MPKRDAERPTATAAAKKEKKMLAKMIRNKKTAAEFSNHKPKASKNTEEKLAKNCY